MTTKCAGLNCTSTDGTNHSPECLAEHAAAVAGGRFVKLPRGDAGARDEREAFEAAAVNLGMHNMTRLGDEYLHDPVNICWLTWQARALLEKSNG